MERVHVQVADHCGSVIAAFPLRRANALRESTAP
jgi:hypothetical protein